MDTFEELKKIVVNQRWEYPFELTRNTRLYEDLKLYGDDAVDFFVAFRSKFKVDLFFKDEGFSILPMKNHVVQKSICLGDLEKAINKGHMDNDSVSN